MNNCFEFDINNIYIIIKKTDTNGLHFTNNCREWDGFVFFINGHGSYLGNDNIACPIENNSLVMLRKNDCYKFDIYGTCTYITSAFDFSTQCDEINNLPKHIIATKKLSVDICSICDIWQKRKTDSLMCCKLALFKLYIFFINQTNEYTKSTKSVVLKAIEFIHDNFKRDFSSEDISEFCSISSSRLRYLFQNQTGMTVTHYRDTLRMENAKEMLASGLFTIKETAYELGYYDVYHFTKVFTKLCEISPAKYAEESYHDIV